MYFRKNVLIKRKLFWSLYFAEPQWGLIKHQSNTKFPTTLQTKVQLVHLKLCLLVLTKAAVVLGHKTEDEKEI